MLKKLTHTVDVEINLHVDSMLKKLAHTVDVEINPGPRSLGIHCSKNEYNPKLYHSKVMDPDTRRWRMDQTFCYPRMGAFEVFVKKGNQRVEVFSKLQRPSGRILIGCSQ